MRRLIDGLRGIAALAVVWVHAGGIVFAGSRSVGDLFDRASKDVYIFSHGVDIFFVISGFVIAYSVGRSLVTPRYILQFAVRTLLPP